MIKKMFIFIIYIIVFYILLEIASLSILIYNHKDSLYDSIKSGVPISSFIKIALFNEKDYDSNYREPSISQTDKKLPIIIFGCSFGEGSMLNNTENISGQLHKLTGRSVYNRSESGVGPQIMFYQFETGKIKNISNDCEYIIYIYIPDHLRRNLMFRCWPFLYKVSIRYMLDKNGNLKLQTIPPFLAYSNIYKLYESEILNIYGYKYSEKVLYKIIEESYLKSKEFYPNSKFIILNYSNENFPLENQVENLGIQVISLSDLTDEDLFKLEYQISEYDSHPNAKAWELITPKLIDKIGIE